MKATVTSRRPCQLRKGEVRRVPQAVAAGLVGYHVACPRCGFVSPALVGDAGLVIDETPELGFSQPLRCVFCRVLVHLEGGEFRLEEDQHVRRSRFR
jgi:hypothetical protein